MPRRTHAAALVLLVAVLLTDRPSYASWTQDGFPVCPTPGAQWLRNLVANPVGGVLVLWVDHRNEQDLYLQRLTANGEIAPGWPADAVAVCTAPGTQDNPTLVPDG